MNNYRLTLAFIAPEYFLVNFGVELDENGPEIIREQFIEMETDEAARVWAEDQFMTVTADDGRIPTYGVLFHLPPGEITSTNGAEAIWRCAQVEALFIDGLIVKTRLAR